MSVLDSGSGTIGRLESINTNVPLRIHRPKRKNAEGQKWTINQRFITKTCSVRHESFSDYYLVKPIANNYQKRANLAH